ncbi:MAG: tRNA (adenosine(37)-N6)-dimethylallyltransferase MiaA [Chitinophagaceae bacterium]|nr:tRNA (adenosine(37)-N6)-dimethylallyltransferase MiaA [Chitinophagaceae bacterium]
MQKKAWTLQKSVKIFNFHSLKTLIVIGGPTGSGKTALAIEIAAALQTEILSADSRQCYREMNIGVARPSSEQLETIPHHFIASHSIQDEMNAASFEKYGLNILNQIFEKNDYAVVCGGTGLYIKALLEGLDEMPPIDPLIRQQCRDEYHEKGIQWLQEQVKDCDPEIYDRMDLHNHVRLLRALEFYLCHRQTLSSYQQATIKSRPFRAICFYTNPDRSTLYQQINQRVLQMMDSGLEAEVYALRNFSSLQALQTVGYKECFTYFNGLISKEECIAEIQQHTRNYAKRQITWFKQQDAFIPILSAAQILEQIKILP